MEYLWDYCSYYFLQKQTLENVLVVGIVALAAMFLVRASRREYWRNAWRQVRANRLAMVCLVVICLYLIVALFDSVAWRDALEENDGTAKRNADGFVIYEPEARSILDRLLAALRDNPEKTYSSPMASTLFVKEVVEGSDGSRRQDYPDLRHPGRHLLGTDKIGNDVFFRALKGIRTAVVIGILTTLLAIPFAIFFGVTAGYFGKWVDDVVQYVYTTLASIPGILLMIGFMMIFGRGLIQLCVVMGITHWTGLCRLLRAETLKLREMEYVQAARALGVGPFAIMYRHVVPNVMHIVLISFILSFSGLVMSEAILTYIGVGVGPETGSWGNMINMARFDLSREPMVWWNFAASLIFMFGLILPVNLFGDAMRDALDPRLRTR